MANILATRKHQILEARSGNIATNLLAYDGGEPYIEQRLCRYPSESDTDFYGDLNGMVRESMFLNSGTTKTTGRRQRAFLNNYARRIATKINQYVFQATPTRDGIDARWALDVTRTGMSLNQFMSEVSALLTVCRWCWIGADRPPVPAGGQSVASREAAGDRVYWQLYDPNEVVDWSFDARGELQWLLLERDEYSNADPRQAAQSTKVRYLYEPKRVTKMELDEKQEDFKAIDEIVTNKRIPFTLVGIPNGAPWWFDDVERIQRSIMDLHSSLDTSIFKTVFPVLVISQGFADNIKSDKITANQARRKIGTGNPIVESAEESGTTRWLSGTTIDLKFIRDEIDRRQNDLYDIVGLAMRTPESRQVASAEAKAWDHLDTEAVLAERATVLEEAEQKCIEMSSEIGGQIFTPYNVSYSRKFDLTDFAEDIKAITAAGGMALPLECDKMLLKAAMRSAAKRFNTPADELKMALRSIDDYEPPEPTYTPPEPVPNQGQP